LKIENWWIVLTNKFLCFNFAECVLEKLIFTFELFAIFFQLFFSFQLVEFFFGQIKLSFMLQLLWKAFWNFSFTRASFNTPKGVCVWLESFGVIDFMLLTSYFGTKFGPIMYNFKPALKNLMRKRSHTPFPHPGAVISCGGGAVRAGSPEEGGGHLVAFCHKIPIFLKKIIKFLL
jgi:hypothetical protein